MSSRNIRLNYHYEDDEHRRVEGTAIFADPDGIEEELFAKICQRLSSGSFDPSYFGIDDLSEFASPESDDDMKLHMFNEVPLEYSDAAPTTNQSFVDFIAHLEREAAIASEFDVEDGTEITGITTAYMFPGFRYEFRLSTRSNTTAPSDRMRYIIGR